MTTQQNDPGEPVPAAATSSRPAQNHHVPALILLWIAIILGCFFIWPSKSYLTDEPPSTPQTAPASR